MILVHVSVEPRDIPKFLAAFRTCFEECKKEPELERFEVFDISAEKGEFCWIETWRGDQDWFCNVREFWHRRYHSHPFFANNVYISLS